MKSGLKRSLRHLYLLCILIFTLFAVTNCSSSSGGGEDPASETTWYLDSDGDSYGDPNSSIEAESQPDDYVDDNTDCNDTNADIHPSASEICDDSLDNDCDGDTDYNDSACYTNNSLGMTFHLVHAGTFMMGSPDGTGGINGAVAEPGRDPNETLHEVTLTQDFYMQTTEVTQGQWEEVMGSLPSEIASNTYGEGDNFPVYYITWYDCAVFCNRLSEDEGLTPCYYSDSSHTTPFDGTPHVTSGTVYIDEDANGYRLPTEAQWEYAARAGSSTAFANGEITVMAGGNDPVLDLIGWYLNHISFTDASHEVAHLIPNDWGLYDMHGNVYEWVRDWYDDYPTGSVIDPVGPEAGSDRVWRGGGWMFEAEYCRAAFRDYMAPDWYSYRLGLRLSGQFQFLVFYLFTFWNDKRRCTAKR